MVVDLEDFYNEFEENIADILERIDVIYKQVTALQEENKELKAHVKELEHKIDTRTEAVLY